MLINGVVERISNANRAGRTVYSLQVNGTWYGGFWNDAPKCAQGNTVEFDATQNGNFWNANPNTLRVVESSAPAQAQQQPQTQQRPNIGGDYASRQNSIVYQSSRKDAIEVVRLALEQDLVTLPTKKADKLGAVIAMIKEITEDFAYEANEPEILSPDERLQRAVEMEANDIDD